MGIIKVCSVFSEDICLVLKTQKPISCGLLCVARRGWLRTIQGRCNVSDIVLVIRGVTSVSTAPARWPDIRMKWGG